MVIGKHSHFFAIGYPLSAGAWENRFSSEAKHRAAIWLDKSREDGSPAPCMKRPIVFGWPGKLEKPGGTVIAYQPQVDEWKDYADITWRQAFQLTPLAVSR
jgi:hypothetical protein